MRLLIMIYWSDTYHKGYIKSMTSGLREYWHFTKERLLPLITFVIKFFHTNGAKMAQWMSRWPFMPHAFSVGGPGLHQTGCLSLFPVHYLTKAKRKSLNRIFFSHSKAVWQISWCQFQHNSTRIHSESNWLYMTDYILYSKSQLMTEHRYSNIASTLHTFIISHSHREHCSSEQRVYFKCSQMAIWHYDYI